MCPPPVTDETSPDATDGAPAVAHVADGTALASKTITLAPGASDVCVSAAIPDANGNPSQWQAVFSGIADAARRLPSWLGVNVPLR